MTKALREVAEAFARIGRPLEPLGEAVLALLLVALLAAPFVVVALILWQVHPMLLLLEAGLVAWWVVLRKAQS